MKKRAYTALAAQLPLLEDTHPDHPPVVNVASVPQRSVFRYPGGKTWLVPHVRAWLNGLTIKPSEMVEPFAGGGIIGLTAVFENLVERATLVERDEQVAAVWQTILSPDSAWLADRIVNFNLNVTTVNETLGQPARTLREKAFQTILKNRVNRGGILASGAGRIKIGENGKGLASRWYPQTLSNRILEIAQIRDRITFIEGDGFETINLYKRRSDVVFFIDPPYTAGGKRAGSRLYTYSEIDHKDLFHLMSEVSGDFLMTYDNTDEVRLFAEEHNLSVHPVAMKSTHHARMTELIISAQLTTKDVYEHDNANI